MEPARLNGNGHVEGEGRGLLLIGIEGQRVKLIKSNLDWLVLDPPNALAIAEEIARLAWELSGKPKTQGKSTIGEMVMQKLYTRVAHVGRDLHERNRSWEYIAKEVVNIVAAEIAA